MAWRRTLALLLALASGCSMWDRIGAYEADRVRREQEGRVPPTEAELERVRPLYQAGCSDGALAGGSFGVSIARLEGGAQAQLQVRAEGLDNATVRRLEQAFATQHEAVIACMEPAPGGAQASFALGADGALAPGPGYGLAPERIECLAQALTAALSGVDRGGATRLWVQLAPAAEVEGRALSAESLRASIGPHLGELRACYELGRAEHPPLRGRTAIEIVIAPDGSVQASSVTASTLGHDVTACCLASVVRGVRFEAPGGGGMVVVTYPLIYEGGP